MSHANYSNRFQTGNGELSRENGIFPFSTIQREEVSSLPPAGSARHPPPTSAVLFEAVTKLLSANSQGKVDDLHNRTHGSSIPKSCGRSIRRGGVPSSIWLRQAHS